MTDEYPDRPDTRRLSVIMLILFVLIILWFANLFGLFDEPKEEEVGMIVRFILFFKQNMLI